jgi:predicted RNA methylase
MYAEFEVHRTMICDRVRTEAFRRAIDSVVRPGDIVLDVGAGSGILSVFAARAGAARVYALERTSAAVLAQELSAANGVAEIVQVIHGDVIDVEPPERVDVIVSEWLGGFGIDEGMLVPVIVARDRWLKPGGVMIPGATDPLRQPTAPVKVCAHHVGGRGHQDGQGDHRRGNQPAANRSATAEPASGA